MCMTDSSRQSRLNRHGELGVFRGHAALEAVDYRAVLVHQKLLEVPGHITCGFGLVEGGVGLGGAAAGMNLVEQFEAGPIGGGAEALDLIKGSWLLGAFLTWGLDGGRKDLLFDVSWPYY